MGRLGEALAGIGGRAALTGADVLALRRAVYDDGRVDAPEARALLELHRAGARGAADVVWADFFVEALADHFALEREVPDHGAAYRANYGRALMNVARAASPIPAHKRANGEYAWTDTPAPALAAREADALIAAFREHGELALDRIEMRLLARLFDRIIEVPASLKAFALEAMVATVAADAAIDAEEVAFVRRILHGPAGSDGLAVSRAEADAVFDMHAAARERAAEWRKLFVRSVAMSVLHGGGSPEAVDGEEAAWLARRLGPAKDWDDDARALLRFLGDEAESLAPAVRALVDQADAPAA